MNTAITPRNDLQVFSEIAAGFWRLRDWNMSQKQLTGFVIQCLEMGITTFDHADIYGLYSCEEIFGKAMAGQSSLRGRMQLLSKCGIKLVSEKNPGLRTKIYDTGSDHIIRSVENSLRALHTDYLDALLIHRPDPLMDPGDTAEAFALLRDSGKVLHFGVSNFLPSQFGLLQSFVDFPLITNQVEISVMKLDAFSDGVLDQCRQYGIKPMAWSPLAGGALFHSQEPQAQRLRASLEAIGSELGNYSIEQVALAWLLHHPSGIIPVLGTGNIERVKQSAEAGKIKLTREQWFSIWMASTGAELP